MENDYYLTPEHYEIAATNGISEQALYRRVYHERMPIKRAITQPLQKKSPPLWPIWKEVAEANGVKQATFTYRVRKLKMDPEEAATMKTATRQELAQRMNENKVRVLTDEQIDTARKNGINYRCLHRRVEEGMPIAEAMTKPTMTKAETAAYARSKRKHDGYVRRSISAFWEEKKSKTIV